MKRSAPIIRFEEVLEPSYYEPIPRDHWVVLTDIRGSTAAIHDELTGAPGSFDQTVAGLGNLARARARGCGRMRRC